MLRFITVQNGRILVIKQLFDKIDGDKYSVMRQFPSFTRSMDDKKYTLPTISWNAKITRVYHIMELQGIKAVADNDISLKKIEMMWQRDIFQNKSYIRELKETYSKKDLKMAGFDSIEAVGNIYEIKTEDIADLLAEINDEKRRILGVNDPVKVL